MVNIGTAFIGGAFVLIALGFQARFTWMIPILDIGLWVIAGLLFISGVIIAGIGIYRTWDEITPNQREKDKRLRTHFDDMIRASQDIILPLTENYGSIAILNSSTVTTKIIQQVSENGLKKPTDELKAHFPKESNLWEKYCQLIYKHNKERTALISTVKEAFQSKKLEVRQYNHGHKSPYIYEEFFHPFFVWCRDKVNQSESPQVDFSHIDAIVPMYDPSDLRVTGWTAEAIAYAENEDDKEKCRLAIRDIINNYGQLGTDLIISANRILKQVYGLKAELTNTFQDIDKFWPGKKDYKFRRTKQCPVCKDIF